MAIYERPTDQAAIADGIAATGTPPIGGSMRLDRPDGSSTTYVQTADGPQPLVAETEHRRRR